jgi:hypothetical protein
MPIFVCVREGAPFQITYTLTNRFYLNLECLFRRIRMVYRLGYGLDDPGIWARFLVKARDVRFVHTVETGSETHTTPYTLST